MAPVAGARFGPYTLISPLGKGGMGAVWLADDPRLDRQVAIKVLPEGFADDATHRERFEREARLLSRLQHPNVCTVFDVGEQEGQRFLVMERLAGETLEQRLRRSPLPIEKVFEIGAQIADGLEAAHRQGLVHRDLKPGNVMLTPGGAKVLDFGLARLADRERSSDPAVDGDDGTRTMPLTAEGAVPGTVPYMSPEQVERLGVDHRSDLFALGAILWEMATGRRAFAAPSAAATISAILQTPPPPLRQPGDAPIAAPLARIVRRCLARDPEQRFQSSRDLAIELRELAREGAGESAKASFRGGPPVGLRPGRLAAAALALLGIGVASGVAIARLGRADASDGSASSVREEVIWEIPVAPSTARLDFSPDGREILYNGSDGDTQMLFRRALHDRESRAVRGSEGAFWGRYSPDGRRLVFGRGVPPTITQDLFLIPVDGGNATLLLEGSGTSPGSWGADGWIYYASRRGQIQRIHPDSRVSEELPFGSWLPNLARPGRLLITTSADLSTTLLHDLASTRTLSAARGNMGRIFGDHALVYYRERAIWVRPFDEERWTVGDEVRLFSDAAAFFTNSDVGTSIAVTPGGRLAYVSDPSGVEPVRSSLLWVQRDGTEELVAEMDGVARFPRLSPSMDRVTLRSLVGTAETSEAQLVLELASGRTDTRLLPGRVNRETLWSSDGARVAYESDRDGPVNVYVGGADGAPPRRVVPSTDPQVLLGLSDRWLIYGVVGNSGISSYVRVLDLESAKEVELTGERPEVFGASLHPGGRWLAQLEERGISLLAIPPAGAPVLVPGTEGAVDPAWSRAGDELFYRQSGYLIARTFEPSDSRVGPARRLFVDRFAPGFGGRNWDVHRDGRFLMVRDVRDAGIPRSLVVVENADVLIARVLGKGGG